VSVDTCNHLGEWYSEIIYFARNAYTYSTYQLYIGIIITINILSLSLLCVAVVGSARETGPTVVVVIVIIYGGLLRIAIETEISQKLNGNVAKILKIPIIYYYNIFQMLGHLNTIKYVRCTVYTTWISSMHWF